MKTLRTLGMSALAVCAATLAVYAQTASAANYTAQGKYDMRGFVSNSTPLFGCSSVNGYISWTPVTVRAPSNMGVRVTVTNYLWSEVPGQPWVQDNNFPNGNSPNPNGGVVLAPSEPRALGRMDLKTPNGFYYYAYVRIDFYSYTWTPMGTVLITPNTAEDWAYTWLPYSDGNGKTYCYK
jgi:hypothetical protein